ncbi:MAG: DUF1570 domain-containing protein [Phycisphaerales bacterium]
MIRFAAIAAISLAPASVAQTEIDDRQARVEAYVRQADAASASGVWGDAQQAWRNVLHLVPDHAVAARELRALHEDGRAAVPLDVEAVGALEAILGDAFYRVETPWFIVLSDNDETWTAARAGVLERAARQYRRTMDDLGLVWLPPESRLVCVLFAHHDDFVAFAREHDNVQASWVAGYYATGTNRAAFYDESTSPAVVRAAGRLDEVDENATRDAKRDIHEARKDLENHARETSIEKTVHEAVHMLAFNCNLQRRSRSYPFWFTEGLATSFETEDPRHAFGPTVEQADIDDALALAHADGKLVPMRELIAVTDPKSESAERASVMYAQSNSFFRYLFRFERDGLATYARALWHAEPRELTGDEHAALFAAHLGDVDKLERRWIKRYIEE